MKEYPLIDAVLGTDQKVSLTSGPLSKTQNAKLSEASLDAIEAKLEALQQEADKVTAAEKDKTTAEATVTALENAIATAATEAEVVEGKTAADTVQALANSLKAYGSQPGETPTQAAAPGDPADDGDKGDGIVDANAEHNTTFQNA